MSKALPIAALILVLFVTPALAHQENISTNDVDIKVKVEVECDAKGQWDNHGSFVSCVAHTRPGGAAVSAAAQSEGGKKSNGPSATPAATPAPSASPTPSPSVSSSPVVMPSPEASPKPEASLNPEASTSPETLTNGRRSAIVNLIDRLNRLITLLDNLL